MPTYDYLCEACGHELEIFQGINDDAVKKCPECKKNKLKTPVWYWGGDRF